MPSHRGALGTASKAAAGVIDLEQTVAEKGSPNSVTDAGVAAVTAAAAALLGLAAGEGVLFDKVIDLVGHADEEYKKDIHLATETLRRQARAAKETAMAAVEGKL